LTERVCSRRDGAAKNKDQGMRGDRYEPLGTSSIPGRAYGSANGIAGPRAGDRRQRDAGARGPARGPNRKHECCAEFPYARLLLNGEVLVAGGSNSNSGYLANAELYDFLTGSWTLGGSMTTARELRQAVLLPSGEVLVAGGENANGILSSAELYNPSTAAWAPTGSMNSPRSNFTLTVLQDGKLLAVQGTSAELYDPAMGNWSATGSAPSSVGGSNAELLPDGGCSPSVRASTLPRCCIAPRRPLGAAPAA
jgi:hypothetical protein